LAFPCFQLSKTIKKAPNIIAQELAEKLQSTDFKNFIAIGGYVNANINSTKFIADYLTNAK
jgi:arginyl-tRNA synthetase